MISTRRMGSNKAFSRSTLSPKKTRMRSAAIVSMLAVALISLSLSGCDDSVDPFIGTDLPFTIWGFMNAGADTQHVRVFAISDELVPDPGPIDAEVFSTDMTTGERRQWSYEQVQFGRLIQGHVFSSPFRAEHERRYRLEVVRSDGAKSIALVTVPSPIDIEVAVDISERTTIPVRIVGDVPNLVGTRVTYNAVNVPPNKVWPVGTPIADPVSLPVTIIYDNVVTRKADAWELDVDIGRDFIAVEAIYRRNCLITTVFGSAPDIWLRDIEFTALAADSTWAPPGGVFDPNLVSVPGTFTNVENGYGFFGAGLGIRYQWTPTTDAKRAAGYNFEAQCNYLFAIESPECMNPPVPCVEENITDLWRIWLR